MSDIQKVDDITVLELGQAGENLVRTIQIDVGAWLEQWPDASIFIVALRPGEVTPYVASTTTEGSILSWELLAVDTGKLGVGWAEVRAMGTDGIVKKSRIIRTVVDRSISEVDSDVDAATRDLITQLLSAAVTITRSKWCVVDYDDGSVELNGGMAEDGGYLVDTTLNVVGMAADAKAVGEALEQKADKGSGIYDPLKAWPVGSVYMSLDATSPATLFGGEWEPLEGVFLLGASETYTVGTKGGEEGVKLQLANLPKEV